MLNFHGMFFQYSPASRSMLVLGFDSDVSESQNLMRIRRFTDDSTFNIYIYKQSEAPNHA